jgi:hypothetical protein
MVQKTTFEGNTSAGVSVSFLGKPEEGKRAGSRSGG